MLPILASECGGLGVIGEQGARSAGRAQDSERQAGVVGLRIVVHEAGPQPRGGQTPCPPLGLRACEAAMRGDLERACEPVIECKPDIQEDGEADAEGRGDADADGMTRACVEREHEGQRAREMRRVAQEPAPLVQPLAHEADVELRQVTDATVDELGRAAAGTAGVVLALHQPNAVAARRGVQRDARAGDTAADHEHVERLTAGSRHTIQGCAPLRRGERACHEVRIVTHDCPQADPTWPNLSTISPAASRRL